MSDLLDGHSTSSEALEALGNLKPIGQRPSVDFFGGLGDVIRRIYRTTAYSTLETITEPHNVILASHNPFVTELFRWHPNRSQLVLLELLHKYMEFEKFDKGVGGAMRMQAVYAFAGCDFSKRVNRAIRGYSPTFHAPDTIESSNHIVFQPYAGGHGRSLPRSVTSRILELCQRSNRQVFIVTRSYLREKGQKIIHDIEKLPNSLGESVTLCDSLSVPATLQLIRNAHSIIGSHSSMLQAAWFEDKPTIALYPDKHPDWKTVGRSYSWGGTRPDCYHANFSNIDYEVIRNFFAG